MDDGEKCVAADCGPLQVSDGLPAWLVRQTELIRTGKRHHAGSLRHMAWQPRLPWSAALRQCVVRRNCQELIVRGVHPGVQGRCLRARTSCADNWENV